MTDTNRLAAIDPDKIVANPNNPRRYFNEERLDQLRTSLQEVGVLVPLIVYQDSPDSPYVLMDGERRWRCALDLALESVPANVIPAPSPLDNLLQMFNIHNVREDWPLISVALSLRDVIEISGEDRESRLAEMTGLTRSTVRRAKRLLSLPQGELDLIQGEAHLDRPKQIHREDLYLEIEAAESVLSKSLPTIAENYDRATIIRQFASKAESGALPAVTDFRFVGKLVAAANDELVPLEVIERTARKLIERTDVGPREAFESVAADAYRQQAMQRKAELLAADIDALDPEAPLSEAFRAQLEALSATIARLLAGDH